MPVQYSRSPRGEGREGEGGPEFAARYCGKVCGEVCGKVWVLGLGGWMRLCGWGFAVKFYRQVWLDKAMLRNQYHIF